ncbi:MAG: hypothetical protein MZV64_09960 [Ignavibacteriales bacterium]|nr:hypothetical protein [Ignavibacteriales bacterium]
MKTKATRMRTTGPASNMPKRSGYWPSNCADSPPAGSAHSQSINAPRTTTGISWPGSCSNRCWRPSRPNSWCARSIKNARSTTDPTPKNASRSPSPNLHNASNACSKPCR